ncbi:Holliday junction branch migration protein RuvA [Thermodesulforhabdus norvegica]|uniref:Holliday junction branch migration complex subunit RuvA n=1 Tax=Thermodesulforhabdus norvegica TaxID=39841 RepID=A0A1I4RF10_9BACT|nr:Holliday junction branch migration protein RuvA [Thermodesulforhabdus norvegica]SFM50626.1 Holliday junction DNA helicase subunit RuvA [Thermodesulforhabdus norvegica]
MIAYLKGILAHKSPDYVIVDVNGVGYGVSVSLNTFYQLPDPGKDVFLHTYTYVREDILQLFGFGSAEEKRLFLELIAIAGVGPRVALHILSGISPQELHQTVMEHNVKRLQKIPGVGKKTAERILLELKHKLKIPEDLSSGLSVSSGKPSITEDAISALMNLGYKQIEAQKAVSKAERKLGKEASLEDLLREALRAMI